MSDSISEQIALLRKFTGPRVAGRVKAGCLLSIAAIAIGLMMAGYTLGDELEFLIPVVMITGFGLAVFQSFKQIHPHALRAREALDRYEVESDTVRIVVEPDDESLIYTAGITDRAGKNWMFRFSPAGWSPKTGDFPAELRYVEGIAWPALVFTDTGILYPQFDPKQERLTLPEEEVAVGTSPKGLILMGIILMVMAFGWSLLMWNMYRLDARIIESGAAVEAEVVKVGHLRAKRGEDHGLVYRFSLPDGRQFERTWSEEDGRWKAYRVGDRILVRYHPDDPERQLVEGRVGTSLFVALIFIALPGLPFFGFGVALVVSGIRKLRADKLP